MSDSSVGAFSHSAAKNEKINIVKAPEGTSPAIATPPYYNPSLQRTSREGDEAPRGYMGINRRIDYS